MTDLMISFESMTELLRTAGDTLYGGEAISQLQHALQAAHFAELAGGDAYAITAALLHDYGHLMANQQHDDLAAGIDDRHEAIAAAALKAIFPAAVVAPIALHVAAKRYLCAVEADYLAALSPTSLRSLQLQGGVMNTDEVQRFAAGPYAAAAVFLRRCDDLAKVPELVTAPLEYYLSIARTVCRQQEAA